VKDYPNLAALPTLVWKATVYSGGIYAVPVPRASTGFVLSRNMARMAEVGDAQPTTPDDSGRWQTRADWRLQLCPAWFR
jgi:putative aldouronate transport system substrate-binding protein